MAISYNTGQAGTTGAGLGNSSTNSITGPASLSNGLAVAFFRVTRSITPSGTVKYGGQTMTNINRVETASGSTQWVEMFYLIAPPTGTNDLTHGAMGLPNQGNIQDYAIIFLEGVAQSGLPEASNTGSGNTATRTVSVTTLTDDAWLAGGGYEAQTVSDGTARVNSGNFRIATKGPNTPVGSFSLAWGNIATDKGAIVASFQPFVAAASKAPALNSTGSFLVM